MFNVFLPKLLEMGTSGGVERVKSLEENLWDVMIFTIGGTPGAIVRLPFSPQSVSRIASLPVPLYHLLTPFLSTRNPKI